MLTEFGLKGHTAVEPRAFLNLGASLATLITTIAMNLWSRN